MPVLARALDVASGFENESAPLERAVKKIKLIEMEFSEINITYADLGKFSVHNREEYFITQTCFIAFW